MIRRLIYLSRATGPITEDDLDQILEASRRNNGAVGISGLLLYHDGTFLQCLEGEKPDVLATLSRIHVDKRHRGIRVILDQEEEHRLFPDWEMGFQPTQTDKQRDGFVNLRDKAESPTASQAINDLIATYFENLSTAAA
jgi:hypothetical protein